MSRFLGPDVFAPKGGDELRLLPLRFERLEPGTVVAANLVGDILILSDDELKRLVALDTCRGDGLYEKACEKLLVCREGNRSWLQILAMRLRTRMAFLSSATALHIFVVTLRCEHSCPYCQVSRRSTDAAAFDMSESHAMRALDIALSAPSPTIKLEFQGGEPLLNFALIQTVVEAAEAKAPVVDKSVEFVIASNLALLTDEVLAYCQKHGISLSTSLDGPAELHNRNRPRPGGNSYELTVMGIRRAQEVLGHDRVSALMTTTKASLERVEQIVDEYLRLDLDGIFLRPLSPYGFAVKTKWFSKYSTSAWLDFYERGLRYILKVNREGHFFPEFYASLLLKRMLTDRPTSYVDLRSPAGIGLGALVYNHDGRVFASDEGRMLAEMGDCTFELGHLADTNYMSLVASDHLIGLVGNTLSQCAPECSSCAFEPHCGADPVYHHATQGDPVGIKPLSGFCARQKGILKLLLRILNADDEDAGILRSWATA
jgi:His-Xaa-Ser system radical SAM maturase HxsB